MKKNTKPLREQLPSTEQLEQELIREKSRKRFGRVLRSTVFILASVAAVAILVATLFLPVMRIYGSSMVPTLNEGEIVVSLKNSNLKTGDIVAFYYNNKVLVKRVICGPGDWINILDDGTVIVNGTPIDEPYLVEKAFGTCDLDLPFQVPENQWFMMGDQRATSIDSRSSQVGCVTQDQIVGKILFCVWPLSEFRPIH